MHQTVTKLYHEHPSNAYGCAITYHPPADDPIEFVLNFGTSLVFKFRNPKTPDLTLIGHLADDQCRKLQA